MKKFGFLLFAVIFSTSLLFAGLPPKAGAPSTIPDLPPLSEEELELFSQIFENMDEETLNALAKIGEDYIKEMEAQGKDPYEIFKEPMIQPTPPPLPKPDIQKPIVQPIILMPPQKVEELRSWLKDIGYFLPSIQHKSASNRETAAMIKPWKYHIEDVVYFMHVLEQEKLFRYLFDKDFDQLLIGLKQLHQSLSSLEPRFSVPEVTLESDRSYAVLGLTPGVSFIEVQNRYQQLLRDKSPMLIKKQLVGKSSDQIAKALEINEDEIDSINNAYQMIMNKQEALETLSNILDSFSAAIYTNNLIENAKKVLAKYEPDALKVKEEQEKREAAARKEQEEVIKRRPVVSPRYWGGDIDYGRPGGGGGFEKPPFIPPAPYIPAEQGKKGEITPTPSPEKKDGKKDGKKDDKKKDEKKKEKEEVDLKKNAEQKAKPNINLPKLSKNVEGKIDNLKDLFGELSDFVNEKTPITRGKETITQAPKELFADFAVYVSAPIATPYDVTNPSLVRAKRIINALTQITQIIHQIKKEIRSDRDLKRLEKREYRQAIQQLLSFYERELFNKELKELVQLKVTPEFKVLIPTSGEFKDITPEMKYMLFGVNEFGDQLETPQYQVIKAINPPIVTPVEEQEKPQEEQIEVAQLQQPAVQYIDHMGSFKAAYNELLKEVKPELEQSQALDNEPKKNNDVQPVELPKN